MKSFIRNFNWLSFASMLALVAIGAAVLASAGAARGGVAMAGKWKAMLGTAAVGLALYFVLALTDYRDVLDWLSMPLYLLSVALLVLVLAVGTVQFGGRRWLWFFQPSEFSKICVMAFLAHVFGGGWHSRPWLSGFRGFLFACAIVGLPCVLILLEPDLGTALALAPAAGAMIFLANVWRKGFAVAAFACFVAAALVLGAVYEAERPGADPAKRERLLKYVPLREHQISRVKTFLFPDTDRMDSGYNLRQSVMTIGSGGLSGKGYRKGESIRRELLPPMGIMNDFIFCVWAEEMGYMKGSLALLALFAVLCLSTAWTAASATDARGRLLSAGVATLVFAHVYVNIGMSIGLVPITGLPLPFLSLGRTFLVTVMCALGLVQSVSLHREERE